MSYQIVLARSAEKELTSLSPDVRSRIIAALQRIAAQPVSRQARKLSQGPGWRVRVGDYRILYTIDKEKRVVTIFAIGHRREVYS